MKGLRLAVTVLFIRPSVALMSEAVRKELTQWLVRTRWADLTGGDRATIKCTRSDSGMVQTLGDGSVESRFVISQFCIPFVVVLSKEYPAKGSVVRVMHCWVKYVILHI